MGFFADLERRVRTDGARPLLVWHQPSSGARVEFSATTFANWLDKLRNWLDDLGWDEEATVVSPLAAAHPCHWQSLVCTLGALQLGARVVVGAVPTHGRRPDVVVSGPDVTEPVPGADTIVCSLHPLGLAVRPPVAGGVLDFHEVLAQPDLHVPVTFRDEDLLLADDGAHTLAELAAGRPPTRDRLVVHALDHRDVVGHLLAVVRGGGSLVVVDGPAAADQLENITASERGTWHP